MTISLFISMYNMEWSPELGKSVLYNNVFACTVCLGTVLLPFFICFYYSWYSDDLHEAEFASRFGALLEGLKLEDGEDELYNRTIAMLFPLFFVLRRLIFCAAAVFLARWPSLQLLVMFYVTTLMVIYLMWFKPFEEKFYTFIEVCNEITVIFLLYFMLTFSEWIPSSEQRYDLAWYFIVIVSLNISVHLFFLGKGVFDSLRLRCKRCINRHTSVASGQQRSSQQAITLEEVEEGGVERESQYLPLTAMKKKSLKRSHKKK